VLLDQVLDDRQAEAGAADLARAARIDPVEVSGAFRNIQWGISLRRPPECQSCAHAHIRTACAIFVGT
jgi:hypothetical protein